MVHDLILSLPNVMKKQEDKNKHKEKDIIPVFAQVRYRTPNVNLGVQCKQSYVRLYSFLSCISCTPIFCDLYKAGKN